MSLMTLAFVAALAADASSLPSSSPPSSSAAGRGVVIVDVPVMLSAQGTASRVETVLTPWLGLRAGWLSHDDGGVFFGGDAALVGGAEGGGTSEVSVNKATALLEARGLVGARYRLGMFGVGGYGYGGGGGGVSQLVMTVYDDSRFRVLPSWTARVGAGTEVSFGVARLRFELGTGLRDARFELHGSAALGAWF
jgi:hypothetical protein